MVALFREAVEHSGGGTSWENESLWSGLEFTILKIHLLLYNVYVCFICMYVNMQKPKDGAGSLVTGVMNDCNSLLGGSLPTYLGPLQEQQVFLTRTVYSL